MPWYRTLALVVVGIILLAMAAGFLYTGVKAVQLGVIADGLPYAIFAAYLLPFIAEAGLLVYRLAPNRLSPAARP